MIFVTVGTQDKQFKRLFNAVEREIEKGAIKEDVIAQVGYTKFNSDKMKVIKMTSSSEEYNRLIKGCSLLITHGGVGSILDGVRNKKIVIAVPRLKRYKEMGNDHQLQIVEEFSNKKYIIGINKVSELGKALKKAKTFKPNKYVTDNKQIVKEIENYIDSI